MRGQKIGPYEGLRKKILEQLDLMSFFDVWDYVIIESGEDDEGYRLRIRKANGRIVESVEAGKSGVKIKFTDRLKAIERLSAFVEENDKKDVTVRLLE